MKDKICLVTGANSGIGKVMAVGLAMQQATVVIACRNKERGEPALADIKRLSGSDNVELLTADLSSQRQVRELADEFKKGHARLDVLINNAGLMHNKRIMTEDGLELQFAVNYLAPFLLTNLLLDVIRASAPARIINVTSGIHTRGKIDFDDLQMQRRYGYVKAYGRSKLADVLFTHELADRLAGTGVTVNCFTPGMTRTGLGRYISGPSEWVFKRISKSPEEGADTGIFLASSPEVEGVTGKYFHNRKAVESSKLSYDKELSKRLWAVSVELTKLQ